MVRVAVSAIEWLVEQLGHCVGKRDRYGEAICEAKIV
jgi:hypothetical protein